MMASCCINKNWPFFVQVPFSLTLRLWDIWMLKGQKLLVAMLYNLIKMHGGKKSGGERKDWRENGKEITWGGQYHLLCLAQSFFISLELILSGVLTVYVVQLALLMRPHFLLNLPGSVNDLHWSATFGVCSLLKFMDINPNGSLY